MDNMLYIVAGLVIIVLIAVLVMRRQKAQPATKPISKAGETQAKRLSTDNNSAPADAASGSTKFDSLAVAERFMDQQRYDKAIETLERGLIQKPHDASLSLKLLNVYAITTQPDDFYKTYEAISAHSDAFTIAQANELKALFDQEHSQTTQILARNETTTSEIFGSSPEGYDSLDFDVDTVANEAQSRPQPDSLSNLNQGVSATSSTDAIAGLAFTDDNVPNSDNKADGIFDLTLDDLESDTLDSETFNESTFDEQDFDNQQNNDDSLSLDSLSLDSPISDELPTANDSTLTIKPDDSFKTVENISEDFSLNFDEPIATSSSIADNSLQLEPQNSLASPSTDDFSLDFDLELDENDFSNTTDSSLTLNNPLTLNILETAATEENLEPVAEFNFDDSGSFEKLDSVNYSSLDSLNDFEFTTTETPADANVADRASIDFETNANTPVESPSTSDADSPLMFDDHTPIDFDSDNLTLDQGLEQNLSEDLVLEDDAQSSTMPVTAASDFAAKFSADFDFVNDLDNNQVTLDLAAKYLELGEYDSAKRLLNEVVTAGNSEQQSQAQALLQRTA